MKLCSASLFAALLLAAPAFAQLPYAKILIAEGDPLGSVSPRLLYGLKAGGDEGWLVQTVLPSATNPLGRWAAVGSLDGIAPPTVLRRSQVINGIDQAGVGFPSLAGGQTAYLGNYQSLAEFGSATGTVTYDVFLNVLPQPTGPVAALAGET